MRISTNRPAMRLGAKVVFFLLCLSGAGLHAIPQCLAAFQGEEALTCLHDGDVNQDGRITPTDALLAFRHLLGLLPLDVCQQEQANVFDPEQTLVTPVDVLCIFQHFLTRPSCLDNIAPQADAGTDQTVIARARVQLDGTASTDAEAAPLRFLWTFASMPTGSQAMLSDPNAAMPTFVADRPGTYTIRLAVSDGRARSAADTVTIVARNNPPVANAGTDQTHFIGDTITLDGSGSRDLDGDTMTFRWTLHSAPPGSRARLTDATSATPTFLADRAGSYAVALVVNDGQASSAADQVHIQATTVEPRLTLVAEPASVTAVQGDQAVYRITVRNSGSQALLATLSAVQLPDGVTAAFTPAWIAPGQTSTLTLSIAPTLAAGSYPLRVRGTVTAEGETYTASQSLELQVTAAGDTTLAGRVLSTTDVPIAGAVVTVADQQTTTDTAGNFLMIGLPEGTHDIFIDARPASTATQQFPLLQKQVTLDAHVTKRIPFLIYIPALDTASTVAITPGASEDVVVTSPAVPGMEVVIPAGTTIISRDGEVVRELSITPVPVDRPPVPLPGGIVIASGSLFTLQPGEAVPSQPLPLTFPNVSDAAPGTSMDLWFFDAEIGDWRVYGTGTVSADGTQIIPDPGVGLPRLAWHFATGGRGGEPGPPGGGESAGDPVDLVSGQFTLRQTDLRLRGRMPIALTRVHRSRLFFGACGVGCTLDVDYAVQEGGRVLVDPDRRQIRFVQQPDGSFIHTSFPVLRGARLTQEADHTFTLRFKNGLRFVFASDGLLESIVNRHEDRMTLSRDAFRTIVGITDTTGRTITLTYALIGGQRVLTRATDSEGRTVTYTYSTALFGVPALETRTDPAGAISHYAFTLPPGGAIPVLEAFTNPRGHREFFNTYDAAGRVVQQTLADGGTFTFAYTLAGSLVTEVAVTDPQGYTSHCRFNASGFMTQFVDASGQLLTLEFEPGTNLLQRVTDPLGRISLTSFDASGDLVALTRPDGLTTRFAYEPLFHQLQTRTDALGQQTTLDYDAQGNVIRLTDALGHVTTLTSNSAGQPVTITDPLNQSLTLTYDRHGALTSLRDALGQQTVLRYDNASRLVALSDAAGRTTRLSYDAADHITEISDAFGDTIELTYDANGNLLTLRDALGQTMSYTYDAKDRRSTVIDPLGQERRLTYDRNDNLIERIDRRGQRTSFTYDPHNRLRAILYDDGSGVTLQYDAVGNLLEVADTTSGTTSFTYDALDRLVRQTMPAGTVEYAYDAIGQRLRTTVAGREPLLYRYDALGRLLSLSRGTTAVEWAYDAINRVVAITRSNGVTSALAYDAADRLLALEHRQGDTILGRMTYAYDASGNRLHSTTDHGQLLSMQMVEQTFGPGNRLLTSGDATFEYDAEGHLQRMVSPAGVTELTWNGRGQLTALDAPELTARFTYDIFHRRLSKTVNGVRSDFLYDGVNIIQQSREGSVVADYAVGLGADSILSRQDSSGTEFFLHDALQSVVLITNTLGAVITRYFYEPYGSATRTADSSNAFQFTGRENDDTGLYYYRARYYHPALGRFISEDPLGLAGGDPNLYAYASNNPINLTDPSGLQAQPPSLFETITNWIPGVKAIRTGRKLGESLPGTRDAFQRPLDALLDDPVHGGNAELTALYHGNRSQQFRKFQQTANDFITSVPGTSISGPAPTTGTDLVLGTVTNALGVNTGPLGPAADNLSAIEGSRR